MAFGISFIKASGVKGTGIGIPDNSFGSTKHPVTRAPECKLIFGFLIRERVGFSCTGGLL